MRRFFLLIITASQLFGALVAFAYFDGIAGQAPFSAASFVQKLGIAGTILIYLLGLLGAILIWTGAKTGLWLSLFHQILIIPIFFIPGIFSWVAIDLIGAIVAAVFQNNGDITFGAMLSFNRANPAAGLNASAESTFFGLNLFALMCAVYLSRLRRDEI